MDRVEHNIKRVLIATDGSEGMDTVYRIAIDMAKTLNAKIYAVYVVDTASFQGLPQDDVIAMLRTKLYDMGWNVLRTLERRVREEGLDVAVLLEEGEPAESIIRVAKKHGIDMIVMGTTGKSGIDRILLGSVAEKVLRYAHCPVLAVRLRSPGD
jgi:nucleotide-binding universal stress UspA family protein